MSDGCVKGLEDNGEAESAAVMMEPVMEFQWGHLPEVDGRSHTGAKEL